MEDMNRRGFLKILAGTGAAALGATSADAAELLKKKDAMPPYPDELKEKMLELDSIYRLQLAKKMFGDEEAARNLEPRLQELTEETKQLTEKWHQETLDWQKKK